MSVWPIKARSSVIPGHSTNFGTKRLWRETNIFCFCSKEKKISCDQRKKGLNGILARSQINNDEREREKKVEKMCACDRSCAPDDTLAFSTAVLGERKKKYKYSIYFYFADFSSVFSLYSIFLCAGEESVILLVSVTPLGIAFLYPTYLSLRPNLTTQCCFCFAEEKVSSCPLFLVLRASL